MQRRSALWKLVDEVQPIIDQFHTLTDEQKDIFLDLVAPLPDAEVAPKAKKTRKKRSASTAGSRRGMPAGKGAIDAVQTDPESARACETCENPVDHNVHHKQTHPGYHEFREAA